MNVCCLCDGPLLPKQAVAQEQRGFKFGRVLRLAAPTGRIAHLSCIALAEEGITITQQRLPGGGECDSESPENR